MKEQPVDSFLSELHSHTYGKTNRSKLLSDNLTTSVLAHKKEALII